MAALAPAARIVRTGRNLGFAAGCNEGSRACPGDLLVILNPDAAPLPGFGEAIRRPWLEQRGLGRLAGAGRRRGRDDDQLGRQPGPLHRHRLGRRPRPADRATRHRPARSRRSPAPAWRFRASTWETVGGFPERFFLYHEDVDLSLRLRLAGGVLGIEPTAVVDHDYEFGAREHKWRWLERNRWAFLIRVYPASLLVLLAPALVATELALIPASVAAGWGRQKLAAIGEVVRWLPRLLRERRQVQATRTVERRRVRLLAHPRPRLALHPGDGPLGARPARPARLLASRPVPAAWMSLSRLAASGGSGSR